jgi:hypothetical protein
VTRDTAVCKAENLCAPQTVNGNCYCCHCSSSDCNQYTAQCQQTGCGGKGCGACSASTRLGTCICGCTKCANTANPISLACPAEIDGYNIGVSNTSTGTFTLTNADSASGYNIDMSLVSTGPNCLCCGSGPSLSTGGGYSIGPGGAQATTITVPFTCTTKNQCYSWNLKVTVKLAISNQAIQSFTCPVKFCLKPCTTLQAGATISFASSFGACCVTNCSRGFSG